MTADNNDSIINWNILDQEISLISLAGRVYANGRQQVKVRLKWTAKMGLANKTWLSITEKQSIRLLDPETGALLPRTLGGGGSGVDTGLGWAVSTMWDGYDYFPVEGQQVPAVSDNSHSEYLDVYVSSEGPSGEVKKVGWQVTRDDGVVFTSTGKGAGLDQSISLVAVKPPVHSLQAYSFVPLRVRGGDDNDSQTQDNYSFNLNAGGKEIGFRNFNMVSASTLRNRAAHDGIGSCTAYVKPRSNLVNYFPGVESLFPAQVQNPGNNALIILMRNVELPTHLGLGSIADVRAVDMQGNNHAFTVSFENNGADLLKLSLA